MILHPARTPRHATIFILNPREAANQALVSGMKTYEDGSELEGGGGALSVGGDSSNEIERGGAGLCDSAFHPKILCELLDLQEIFSVNCGTGGGQRPQHVRLQRKHTFALLLPTQTGFLRHPLGLDVGPHHADYWLQ